MQAFQSSQRDSFTQDTVLERSSRERPIQDWGVLLKNSLRRILRWHIPPRWADQDWHDEIHSEIVLAALQAYKDFDASRGVPWEAFLRQRVLHTALARYRREWTYSLRISGESQSDLHVGPKRPRSSELTRKKLLSAVQRLPIRDVTLIESLFWGSKTESEMARRLGISQQAVNKRKRTILRQLERVLDSMELGAEIEP